MPLLDFDAIIRTPKNLVGFFSDATFLLNSLVDFAPASFRFTDRW